MKKTGVLFYKEFHNRDIKNISYFGSFEEAEDEAEFMIKQFAYWGGGSVPISVLEYANYKNGHKKLMRSKDYTEDLYIKHAKESGTDYGHYQDMQKGEFKIYAGIVK